MESSSGNADVSRGPSSPTSGTILSTSSSDSSTRQQLYQFTASDFFHSPISSLLEYSGILGTRSNSLHSNASVSNNGNSAGAYRDLSYTPATCLDDPGSPGGRDVGHISSSSSSNGEVSIRILGAGEQEDGRVETALPSPLIGQTAAMPAATTTDDVVIDPVPRTASATSLTSSLDSQGDSATHPPLPGHDAPSVNASPNAEPADGVGFNQNRDSSYQRYDIQQAARWIEQVLPFSLLLLVVFVRQHLQVIGFFCSPILMGVFTKLSFFNSLKAIPGFIVTIWVAAFMFKSNDILRKQTALKGERRHSVLFGISLVFTLHVISMYWWFQTELLYSLVLIPPKAIPPFWHATFIIVVNDTLVRQAAMVLKCVILMYYKNSRGRNYRKQGQMLTLVEYFLLLYRALLPAPVWYRFFFNKEYGSVFSSLVTGLYLTFKLTSIVEKVQYFFASFKALFRKEIMYGAYATSEQVSAAGDLCVICQEKMHAPILLRCKHIFCEDCVSEWFERERTCPLCRALVKPADIRSFGDGSTSLFFQLF